MVIVVSSPSGGGKSTIVQRLVEERGDCGYSVSATTRAPRPGEVGGVDYQFLTESEFERRIDAGEFAEFATYHGHRYGTLSAELLRITHGGQHAMLDIEVMGARQVRSRFPDAVLIFIVPPTGAALARRLEGRGTEPDAVIAGRLQRAIDELGAAIEYDYVVVNQDVETALQSMNAIIDAEMMRTGRQRDLAVVLDRLRAEVATEAVRAATAH